MRSRLATRNAAEIAARSTATAHADRMVRRLFLLANRVSRVIAPCQSSLGAGDGERPVRPGEILRGASAKESNFMAIFQSGIDDAPPITGREAERRVGKEGVYTCNT